MKGTDCLFKKLKAKIVRCLFHWGVTVCLLVLFFSLLPTNNSPHYQVTLVSFREKNIITKFGENICNSVVMDKFQHFIQL
jgi:hypothetical protein